VPSHSFTTCCQAATTGPRLPTLNTGCTAANGRRAPTALPAAKPSGTGNSATTITSKTVSRTPLITSGHVGNRSHHRS
jgi:hypothetical protein